MTSLPLVLGLHARPRRGIGYGLPQKRVDYCPCLYRCLDHAADSDWCQMSCEGCPVGELDEQALAAAALQEMTERDARLADGAAMFVAGGGRHPPQERDEMDRETDVNGICKELGVKRGVVYATARRLGFTPASRTDDQHEQLIDALKKPSSAPPPNGRAAGEEAEYRAAA